MRAAIIPERRAADMSDSIARLSVTSRWWPVRIRRCGRSCAGSRASGRGGGTNAALRHLDRPAPVRRAYPFRGMTMARGVPSGLRDTFSGSWDMRLRSEQTQGGQAARLKGRAASSAVSWPPPRLTRSSPADCRDMFRAHCGQSTWAAAPLPACWSLHQLPPTVPNNTGNTSSAN
jgi:hypothetical protein